MSAPQKPDSVVHSPLSKSPEHCIEPSVGSLSNERPELTDFKVYNPALKGLSAPPTLPDSFFTPTPADLRAAQAQLTARSQALTNAPLQVRAQREAELKAKLDRWPETRIRIKFTDGTQLEKVFPSTNKIRSIYAFVRGCLREDVKPIKFVLSQPPKHDLKVSDLKIRDLSLAQLQLAPSSLLLLRFEDESLNHDNVLAPLHPCILTHAVDLPGPPQIEKGEGSSETKITETTVSSSKEAEAKVPKWMKFNRKK